MGGKNNMVKKYDKNLEIIERDEKVFSNFSRLSYFPLTIKRAHGSIIEDMDGNEYIDMISAASTLNTGSCHPKIVQAIKDQADKCISYTAAYTYSEPLVKLSEMLCEITPGNFEKRVLFGVAASDSNDAAIKLARAYTGKTKMISFIGAYHGSTYGAISLSAISLNMRRKIGPLLPEIEHIRYPNCYRCQFKCNPENCSLECLEDFKIAMQTYIPPDEIAAVIMEPIEGDGGLIVPPIKYMKAIYNICKDNNILFISEEVQQGLGRTGKWFGIEHFGIIPDLIVMGKSLGAGLPLSAVVGKKEIFEALGAPAHLFSMTGNQTCCAASIASINVIKDEKLLDRSRDLGAYAKSRFEEMKSRYDIIGEVRGLGLSIGVDLVKDRESKVGDKNAAAKICCRAWEKGVLLIYLADGVLRIQPPLVITKEELDKAINIIEESIVDYLNGNIPDEILKFAKGW